MPIVTVTMREGFTVEQKRRIVKDFTDTLVNTLGIPADLVTILVYELPTENIGKAGRLRSDPPA
jgi:4-oxalocrotonate tautomerase